MLNECIFIGRLTRDPELRYTPANSVAVTNFTLAVDRPYKNQQGEREADFIRVVAWRKLAETVCNNLQKGRLIAIHGRLQVRNYEDDTGQRRTISEIVADNVVFLDWPKDGNKKDTTSTTTNNNNEDDSLDGIDFLNNFDDVPF